MRFVYFKNTLYLYFKPVSFVYFMLLTSAVVSFTAIFYLTGDLWFNSISYLAGLVGLML
jgi:hypothetical protein